MKPTCSWAHERCGMSAVAPVLALLALGSAPTSANLQHVGGPYPLLNSTPPNCVAIETPRTHLKIVLDKNELMQLANGSARHVASNQRRMASIRSQRASSLLADTSTHRNKIGCYINSKLVAQPPRAVDWVYVVFYIFKQGHGRVWDATSNSFLKSYQYTTYGAHCGWCPAGFESLRSLSGQTFLEAELYVR